MKRSLLLALLFLCLSSYQALADMTVHPARDALACKCHAQPVSMTLQAPAPAPSTPEPLSADAPAKAPAKAREGCGCSDSCECGPFCQCKDEDKESCSKDCPCKKVLGTPAPRREVQNYGRVEDAPRPPRERYTISGQAISPLHAYHALTGQGAAAIPDDRQMLSLTLAGGTDEQRAAALKAIAALGLDTVTLVQSYPADNPLLKPGFVTPSTYLQLPSGQVIARSPLMTAQVLAALRKAVPGYEPARDPDPMPPPPAPQPPAPSAVESFADKIKADLEAVPGWLWVVIVGVGLVAISPKQQS